MSQQTYAEYVQSLTAFELRRVLAAIDSTGRLTADDLTARAIIRREVIRRERQPHNRLTVREVTGD